MPGGNKKGGGLKVKSAYKMKGASMYSPMMKKKKKTLAEALSGLHSYISKGFKTPEGKSRLGESIKKAKSGLEGVIGKGGTLEKAMKRKKKVTRTFHPKKKQVEKLQRVMFHGLTEWKNQEKKVYDRLGRKETVRKKKK